MKPFSKVDFTTIKRVSRFYYISEWDEYESHQLHLVKPNLTRKICPIYSNLNSIQPIFLKKIRPNSIQTLFNPTQFNPIQL
jgi:hypothetical protein